MLKWTQWTSRAGWHQTVGCDRFDVRQTIQDRSFLLLTADNERSTWIARIRFLLFVYSLFVSHVDQNMFSMTLLIVTIWLQQYFLLVSYLFYRPMLKTRTPWYCFNNQHLISINVFLYPILISEYYRKQKKEDNDQSRQQDATADDVQEITLLILQERSVILPPFMAQIIIHCWWAQPIKTRYAYP